MVEEEPMKKMSKKELLKLDEELALKVQDDEDEEERLAREKAQKLKEANIAWDDIQAKVERVNTFVDMDTELVKESSKKAEAETVQESSSKRAGEALEQESSKKQKVDDDKETEELKQCMEIISDNGDGVTIEATPLSTKSPTIVDYKIYKEGKKSYLSEQMMLYDVKLQVDYECEMTFELLRLVKKQLKEGYGRIVGIKSLLEVTAVKITTAKRIKTAQGKEKRLLMGYV
ncbi:hypothetical protein Tco_0015918 [Tanacetum coccineum]